jgi:endonuclease/exonuclease/phosphatase family metal-dependent hydrolase
MRPSRRTLLLTLPGAALAVLLAVPAPAARPDRAEAPVLRVGTWNVEWLGRPDRRASRVAQKPEDVARYVALSGVDLLCLNEVSNTAPDGPPANETLTRALALLKEKTGQEWRQLLFAKDDPAEKDQWTGVVWNTTKVRLVGQPMRVPLRRGPGQKEIWTRQPWAAKFSAGEGKTDFVVIPVHMKSNRGGEEVTGKQRLEEARALVRSLGAVQNEFRDDDLILLGDFNCLRADEPALAPFAAAGFRDLNADDRKTWIADRRFPAAPFDRILVPVDQPEFRDCKLRVVRETPFDTEDEFRRNLSDHYMVVTEVRILDDDD